MEYGEVADQAAPRLSVAAQQSKKARGGGASDRARPTQRCCGECGGTRHNARTCQAAKEESSELDVST